MNRRPIRPGETEALYRVHVTCSPEDAPIARDLLSEELERHGYPVRDIEVLSETEEVLELAASLVPTSADWAALDHVVAFLQSRPEVESATWSVSTLM